MLDAPRPRRWFQLHLTTCIALMFAAGGLIWLNARTRHETNVFSPLTTEISIHKADVVYQWGWPLTMNHEFRSAPVPLVAKIPSEVLDDLIENQDFSDFPADADQLKALTARPEPFSGNWKPRALAQNAAVWVLILFATACALELALRKRRR